MVTDYAIMNIFKISVENCVNKISDHEIKGDRYKDKETDVMWRYFGKIKCYLIEN